MDDSVEEWKPVVGYEELYEVSSHGRIKSNHPCWQAPRIMRHGISRRYAIIDLSKDGKRKTRSIHRLVMAAFVGPCPDGKEVNHKDGVTVNNRLGNLEYVTKAENYEHATRNFLYENGERRHSAKLTADQVREMRRLAHTMNCKAISKLFGVSHQTAWRIVKRTEWRHVD